jgi:hypothetical protein
MLYGEIREWPLNVDEIDKLRKDNLSLPMHLSNNIKFIVHQPSKVVNKQNQNIMTKFILKRTLAAIFISSIVTETSVNIIMYQFVLFI